MSFTLNIKGKLHEYTRQAVMGILNITPDSFHAASRVNAREDIMQKALAMARDGADFIDIGAYSTRPGHSDVSVQEERSRLAFAIDCVREALPDMPISVDTFRADVAKEAVEVMGADIINDVTGGTGDSEMFCTVSALNVPYILTHCGCADVSQGSQDHRDIAADVIRDLAFKVSDLCLLGVNDIIVDPGFGFGKTTGQNYQMLRDLDAFKMLKLPLLVGISRKSMITKPLEISADEALNGTTVLNTIALLRGADILRVHDVKAAREAVELTRMTLMD